MDPAVSLTLNVLCQSPVSEGMTPTQAVHNTVDLARYAEAAGYARFWVAEHHSDAALASAAPEVMVAHLAASTSRMRIGSGGVLMPFRAPLAVAEQFALLGALHPGRIDLGVGRSGGSEGHAPQALGVRSPKAFDAFDELLGWLAGRGPYADTVASPAASAPAVEPWVLGTSPGSATFAGERGLPYAFGGFLDPRALVPALTAYHTAFRPSRWGERPRVNLGWYVQAAETEAEAHALTRSSEHWFVESFVRGGNPTFPDPSRLNASYGPMEQLAIGMRRSFALVGTAEQVVEGLDKMARELAIDEFTLVTIPFEHEARVASYTQIARVAGLA